MKKIKFYYNTRTLRFEKLVTPLRVKVLRILAFLISALLTALGILFITSRFFPSPETKLAEMQYQQMKDNYQKLSAATERMQSEMHQLERRDNEVYRSIFQATPVPDSIRMKEISEEKHEVLVTLARNEPLGNSIAQTLNSIDARVKYQRASYNEIEGLIKNQSQKLAALPAIQPVSNKDLDRLASGFGMRIDPVYGTPRMHKGLDFTAPKGTPIYATGDGFVIVADFDIGGYGNHVVINHGYGYQTLFGHMSRIKVRKGERVKRGEVIGYVGSTGKSTGPHCHYEVHLNGREMNPVYFFYNDLTPEQYDRILKIASTGSAKSMD